MEALRKEIETLKSWLEEADIKLHELRIIIFSYQKEAGLKEDHIEYLKEWIKIVQKEIFETRMVGE